jgi:uncharacterized protein involved in type VI secretion and phage assembly
MTVTDDLRDLTVHRWPSGYGSRFYGVHPAVVTDVDDPTTTGRVKIRLPWSPDSGDAAYETWARLATLMAGSDRGTWFVPDVDDEVLVAFEAGDPTQPFVIGALWNGKDAPPESMASGNDIKAIHSRNGVVVTFDDTDGQERLRLETPAGQVVTLADGPSTITVADANQNTVTLDSSGVTVQCSAKVTVNGSEFEVTAGKVTVNAGMSTFSGVVKADTVIANSVVSSSYTPGAGNMW